MSTSGSPASADEQAVTAERAVAAVRAALATDGPLTRARLRE